MACHIVISQISNFLQKAKSNQKHKEMIKKKKVMIDTLQECWIHINMIYIECNMLEIFIKNAL